MHIVQKEVLEKAGEDLTRLRSMVESGGISQEELKKALASFSEKIETILSHEGN